MRLIYVVDFHIIKFKYTQVYTKLLLRKWFKYMIYSGLYGKLFCELSGILGDVRLSAWEEACGVLRDAVWQSSVCNFGGRLYYFGGRYYEPLGVDGFTDMLYCLLREKGCGKGVFCRFDGLMKILKHCAYGKRVTLDNRMMVFGNCVLDMDTGETMPFTRDVFQITGVDFDYNPKARCVKWKKFLEEVLPDETMRDLLQEFLGAVFVDRKEVKIETMLVLLGRGANGKSVVFETVMGLLGRDNVGNFGIADLVTGSERKKNVAFINGKRLNYCSELRMDEIRGSGDELKSLISGEPMDARALYGDNFMAYDIPLLMANSNRFPFVKDFSFGLRRRIKVIPFDVKIPTEYQDKELAQKLRAELPGIFNWAMEGRERLKERGYRMMANDAHIDEMLQKYSQSNSALRFMAYNKWSPTPDEDDMSLPKWVNAAKIYRDYKDWCLRNGALAESVTVFGEVLADAGFVKKRRNDGMAYALFGLPSFALTEEEKEHKEKIIIDNSTPVKRGRRRLVYTFRGAARFFKVSEPTIRVLVRTGVLKGCFHMEKKSYVFDVDLTMRALKKHGYYKGTLETDKERRDKEEAKMVRHRFNTRMKLIGLPFRKYGTPGQEIEGETVVNDDFTIDN